MADTDPGGDLIDELAEEFARRWRAGERPSVEDYARLYPELADEIRTVLPAVVLIERHKPRRVDTVVPGAAPAPPPPERPPERVGEYRILREIGRGGMGVVYEAEQETLGRRVAVKLLPAHLLADARLRARFLREARAAARLHHTNIVPVFAVGEQDGRCFYAMQLIRGRGLDRVAHSVAVARGLVPPEPPPAATLARGATSVAPDGPAPDPEPAADLAAMRPRRFCRAVARIGAQAADALAYAHEHGVVHRDVKPSNLLLDDAGAVWVTDFGVARLAEEASLTQSGDLPGTLRYMPPERFAGRPGDERGDVYSLGVTLYELLTLRPAFPDTTPQHLIGLIGGGIPAPPRALDPAIPADLETVVLKAAARDPKERYSSAAALAEDLRRFLDDRPVRAKRVGPAGRAWRWSRRNPALAGTTAAVFVLMVLVTVFSVALVVRTEAARRELAKANKEVEDALAAKTAALDAETEQRRQVEAVSALALAGLNRAYERDAPTRLVVTPSVSGGADLPRPAALAPEAVPVLDDLLKTYERIARLGEQFPALHARAAEAHHRMGDIRQRLGRFDAAAAAYRAAIALYARLPADAEVPVRLARAHNELGRVLHALHRLDESKRAHEQAVGVLTADPAELAARPEWRFELACAYQALGRWDRLLSAPPGPPPAGPPGGPKDGPPDGPPPGGFGPPPDEPGGPPGRPRPPGGPPPDARPDTDSPTGRAIGLLRELIDEDERVPEYRHLLARCYRDLRPGGPGPGRSASNAAEAVRLLDELVRQFPHVPDYRFELCEALADPGGPTGRPDDPAAAAQTLEWLRRADHESGELVRRYPSVPEYAAARARYLDRLGVKLTRSGKAAEALPLHRRAVDDLERLVKESPGVVAYAAWLGMAERSLGEALAARGEWKEARFRLESAVGRVGTLLRQDPRLAGLRPMLGMAYRDLAGVLGESGEPVLAAEARRKAEEFGPDPRLRGPPGRGKGPP